MNRVLKRRLNRIYKLRYFGRIYKILETWNELELCYLYQLASKPKDCFWESIPELLEKSEIKNKLNELINDALLQRGKYLF